MRAVIVRTSAVLLLMLCATAGSARADCPEGTPQAACVLHEEGVVLLTSSRFEQAATKFRAAIAAAPSARSYLGYSQAVEGQGKLALAYETMLVAQRLSNEELKGAGAKDPAKIGRAERIKYKISELAGRVGFVWLRLPEGVPPQRLVSIHREGEGDLPSPIGRWVTVAPDKQVLIASLDDGSQVQVVAKVAAGSQSSLVLPIPAPRQPMPQLPPLADAPRYPAVYQPPPMPPPMPPPATSSALAVGMTILSSGPRLPSLGESLGTGVGLFGLFERRLSRLLALTARADYVSHLGNDISLDASLSGYEVMLLAGLRTNSRPLHARVDAGVTVSTVEVQVFNPMIPPTSGSQTDVHPVIGLGAGLSVGRVRIHAGLLYAANPGADGTNPEMPLRFMAVLGVDLWRR